MFLEQSFPQDKACSSENCTSRPIRCPKIRTSGGALKVDLGFGKQVASAWTNGGWLTLQLILYSALPNAEEELNVVVKAFLPMYFGYTQE